MDSKEFKTVFGDVAKAHDFKKAFGGWYKESPECIAILELQKSSYADRFYLNVKIFVQGVFGKTYTPSKDLIKSSMGHVNASETKEYSDILYFDEPIDDNLRIERLRKLFENHILPFTSKTLSKSGIRELADKGDLFLLPAIKEELA